MSSPFTGTKPLVTSSRRAGPVPPGNRSPASLMAGSGVRVGEVQDSVAIGLRSGERELGGRGGVGEQPLTTAMCQWVDEQVQVVDQAVGQHRPDQGPAAADVDVAVDLVLEVTDRARAVGAKDRGVAPVGGLQRGGD